MFLFNGDRTPLNEQYITVKFKSVFPDFKTWKDNLTAYGIADADIKQEDFNMLQTMLGNAYLKFKTDVKNKGMVAFAYKDELFKLKKRKMLTDLTLEDVMNQTSINEQTLYTINKSELTGAVEPKFVDNKVVSELTNKVPKIDKIKEIKEFTSLSNPELLFLLNLAGRIIIPLQPRYTEQGVL